MAILLGAFVGDLAGLTLGCAFGSPFDPTLALLGTAIGMALGAAFKLARREG